MVKNGKKTSTPHKEVDKGMVKSIRVFLETAVFTNDEV